jgi:hypothetical protein
MAMAMPLPQIVVAKEGCFLQSTPCIKVPLTGTILPDFFSLMLPGVQPLMTPCIQHNTNDYTTTE